MSKEEGGDITETLIEEEAGEGTSENSSIVNNGRADEGKNKRPSKRSRIVACKGDAGEEEKVRTGGGEGVLSGGENDKLSSTGTTAGKGSGQKNSVEIAERSMVVEVPGLCLQTVALKNYP